jgi:hypothetical protein
MTDIPQYEIRGGADPALAAAIGALVAHLFETEAQLRSQPSRRPRQSPWALTARPREIPDPLPSHTYDSTAWSASNDIVEDQ